MTYHSPELAFALETNDHSHIRNGYEILRAWEYLPVIRRGLNRSRKMMVAAGIPVDGLTNRSGNVESSFVRSMCD
jgi:hypothetical protein